MTGLRKTALAAISVLVASASRRASPSPTGAAHLGQPPWPARHLGAGVVDSFIAVGELALFVALAASWSVKSRAAAWTVTAPWLAVSVAGNIGRPDAVADAILQVIAEIRAT
jgi:hypothetical protein